MYAVNIGDWTAHRDDLALQIILTPIVDRHGSTIDTEPGRFDGMAIALVCPDEQAQAIVEVVRLRIPKYALRFYQSKTGKGGWKRV